MLESSVFLFRFFIEEKSCSIRDPSPYRIRMPPFDRTDFLEFPGVSSKHFSFYMES
ncbi:hypothetical protein [Candidatus Similichlamydia laticola]|uniref:Uncharacterized protein n=1 Tax=Candidatus Similichlamydia laticola TaxID=2170265 RepID=A0A369KD06_9BACT|nr:hypothetical protein [Candidatus Similichlamydia laticola]RDB31340.1 hypothetical protein HAT2_00556 [Candidatus Similichlamydia laticola]